MGLEPRFKQSQSYEASILGQLVLLAKKIGEICGFLGRMAEGLAEKGEKYGLI